MTTFSTTPQFGGDIAAFFTKQDQSADPTTPPTTSTFGAVGAAVASNWVPLGIVNVPEVRSEAQMDNVFGIGSYVRLQRNIQSVRPALRFSEKFRSIAQMAMAVRNGAGELDYFSLISGNAQFARQMVGAKCESLDIDIPLTEAPATASYGFQGLYAGPTAASVPAMTYGDATLPIYYGYNAALTLNGDDYTDFVRRVRISIKHELERLPPKRKSISLSGTATIVLVSRHLKAKSQVTTVSFELYQGLPLSVVGDVAKVCRTAPTVALALTDDCHPGRGIGISLPDLSFGSDVLDGVEATALATFGAEADARTFVLTETQPT